jgi:ABC-type sugar transport system substrate-binding protein
MTFTLAVDFDGTCVEHIYPETGQDVPGAVECLRKLDRAGVQIILWTMRSDQELEKAVNWFTEKGIKLFGVNNNPTQHTWTNSPKAYAHYYVDDAAIGCPLADNPSGGRPWVDWNEVETILAHKMNSEYL